MGRPDLPLGRPWQYLALIKRPMPKGIPPEPGLFRLPRLGRHPLRNRSIDHPSIRAGRIVALSRANPRRMGVIITCQSIDSCPGDVG